MTKNTLCFSVVWHPFFQLSNSVSLSCRCVCCPVLLLCCNGRLRRRRVLSSARHSTEICCASTGWPSVCYSLGGFGWIIGLNEMRSCRLPDTESMLKRLTHDYLSAVTVTAIKKYINWHKFITEHTIK